MVKEQNQGSALPEIRLRGDVLLESIAAYVDAHLAEKVTLGSVAQLHGVSVSTVTQQFQKRGGITFHRYLTLRRMEAAQTLIREGTPLEEVGKLVGYTDHSTFYRAFKQTFGLSPREFRRQEQLRT